MTPERLQQIVNYACQACADMEDRTGDTMLIELLNAAGEAAKALHVIASGERDWLENHRHPWIADKANEALIALGRPDLCVEEPEVPR